MRPSPTNTGPMKPKPKKGHKPRPTSTKKPDLPAPRPAVTEKSRTQYAKRILARGGIEAVNKRRKARGVKPIGNKVAGIIQTLQMTNRHKYGK